MTRVFVAALMDSDPQNASAVPRGSLREHDPNGELEFVRGEGVYLWDTHGRRYLDFVSGYSSTLFGHCHPRFVEVAREQLGVLTQLVGLQHPWRRALEARLVELAPMTPTAKVWLASTGARAIEIAWKLAYAYRPGCIVAFDLAYHGRSIATSLLSDTQRLPILQGDVPSPLRYPRCQACPVGLQPTSCHAECFDDSKSWIEKNADKISSIVVEPAIGARGYYYAPPFFFQRLREVTWRHNIVLIDDEIQMGLGRFGTMFASQSQGWEPDLAILGKSLGGGIVAISAVVGRTEIMDSLPQGYESETFAANPLACRLALETLELLVRDRMLERAKQFEAWIESGLRTLQMKSSVPIQVSCQGASGVVEIQTPPPKNAQPASEVDRQSMSIALRWVKQARDSGLLLHLSGIDRNRIVMIPPLIADETHFQEAFDILEEIVGLNIPLDVA